MRTNIRQRTKLKETNRDCYFQQNGQWSWCVGTPIYLKHCDKNQAQELKNQLAQAQTKQAQLQKNKKSFINFLKETGLN